MDNPREDISLFDFCSSVRLVQLESIPQAMTSPLSERYLIDNGLIYILDSKDYEIRIFDSDGKWLENLGRVGRAGYEYVMASSFLINHQKETIDVLNPVGQILQYSLSQRHEMVNKIQLPETIPSANRFELLDDGQYVLYSVASAEYYLFNPDNGHVKRLGEIMPAGRSIVSSILGVGETLMSADGRFLTYRKFDGEIYTMGENSDLVPYHVWNVGPHGMTLKHLPVYKDMFKYYSFARKNSFRYATFQSPIFDDDRYIISSVRYKSKFGLVVYEKQSDSSYFLNHTKEGLMFLPKVGDRSCAIYLVEDPSLLDMLVNESVLNDSKSKEIFDSASDDNNCVLIMYSFK